ncbi:hydroxysqualene dehydroxylase HpnE [Methylophilus aquaticus]|uniref:Hydroxysqualene dehydroxylase HpnE n=1 Tax=Methylophilus aquaticus TaxID=1971610 RepID=A0ABT9JT40_9PROT|nr:hydroxysqualene dehydroxylase HpnE [Methylophilus aquaticus]MDP8567735.1 hydroxysqualene dehydroxylase HpnE [Methylophilus aquaticus]
MSQQHMHAQTHSPRSVAVVGAGLAGLSAALHLIKHGHHVTLYEAAPQAGGRARGVSMTHAMLDNGQHLCLGAYQATLQLLAQAGLTEQGVFLRLPLALYMHDGAQRMSLVTSRYLPAPLHLVWGLCTAQGLSGKSKWRALSWMLQLRRKHFQLQQDMTVADLLTDAKQTAQSIRWLWEPLCLAALNTPITQASGQVFLHVLRDSFQYRRSDSDFLIVRQDLTSGLIQPLLQHIIRAGGQCQLHATVSKIAPYGEGAQVYTANDMTTFDAVIVAVGPHQLKTIEMPRLPQLSHFSYQPITTIYMQFSADFRLPYPVMGLCHGLAQWVFDRGQCCAQPGLLAFVISAHDSLPSDKATLIQQCITALNLSLKTYGMQLPETPAWSQIITEKRATFSCNKGLERPASDLGYPQLFIAGDYVAGDYPATIEGAVRSGMQAAEYCLAH